MPKVTFKIVAVAAALALAGALSITAQAAGRGGHGGGGGGRGGGGHGGGAHFGGGGRGGGVHIGGGGGRHFGGGGGRAVARSFSRPSGGNRFAGRSGNNRPSIRANREASRAVIRENRAAARNAARANNNNNRNNITNRSAERSARDASRRTNAVRSTLNSRSVAGAMNNRSALRNANARARITASAALAGWRGRGRGGWWRHGHGGYGWVGPLFWPFAYYDVYNYALWGNGYDYSFWDYGYNDIYTGLFAPYGYDDLAGYVPPSSGGGGAPLTTGSTSAADPTPQSNQLAQMCGDDSRDIAGLPIDQIQQTIQPNDDQRAALDELANASAKAAQDIKAVCPTTVALTAPARLAAMQRRIEAMIGGMQTIQPALEKFYGLLNDEQKARLTALGQNQRDDGRKGSAKVADTPAQDCGGVQPGITDWPSAKITDALQPTEDQRASLAALQDASARAADMLKSSCQPSAALTPPARLAAATQRLDTMQQAVKTVSVALNDFYGKLTDEQKAQFEAIGPKQAGVNVTDNSSASDDGASDQPRRRRHHASLRGIIRHFIRW